MSVANALVRFEGVEERHLLRPADLGQWIALYPLPSESRPQVPQSKDNDKSMEIDMNARREALEAEFQEWWADYAHALANGHPGDVVELFERLKAAEAKAVQAGSA